MPIIFSNFMASPMSPLIFSFPDMNAIVGFNFPIDKEHGFHQYFRFLSFPSMIMSVVYKSASARLFLPPNILMKSELSSVMTTSALTGGSPLPALPASFFRSMYQTPACSPVNRASKHVSFSESLVSFSERGLQPCYRPAESSSKQIKHAWTSKSRCSGLPDNYRQVWWSRVGTEVYRTGNGSLWHSHDLWFDISCQK